MIAGRPIDLHASSRVPGVSIEVARLGQERDRVWSGHVEVGDHLVPDDAWRRQCDWPAAVTIATDPPSSLTRSEAPRRMRADGPYAHGGTYHRAPKEPDMQHHDVHLAARLASDRHDAYRSTAAAHRLVSRHAAAPPAAPSRRWHPRRSNQGGGR